MRVFECTLKYRTLSTRALPPSSKPARPSSARLQRGVATSCRSASRSDGVYQDRPEARPADGVVRHAVEALAASGLSLSAASEEAGRGVHEARRDRGHGQLQHLVREVRERSGEARRGTRQGGAGGDTLPRCHRRRPHARRRQPGCSHLLPLRAGPLPPRQRMLIPSPNPRRRIRCEARHRTRLLRAGPPRE